MSEEISEELYVLNEIEKPKREFLCAQALLEIDKNRSNSIQVSRYSDLEKGCKTAFGLGYVSKSPVFLGSSYSLNVEGKRIVEKLKGERMIEEILVSALNDKNKKFTPTKKYEPHFAELLGGEYFKPIGKPTSDDEQPKHYRLTPEGNKLALKKEEERNHRFEILETTFF